ncbi:MAG: YfiR family protein [Desulfuromonas sp.]|nr:YfiR family protein [Desulfuromonas sp.]
MDNVTSGGVLNTGRLKQYLALLFICLALVSATSASSAAEQLQSDEYQLKAAFIYNFIKFTSWPEQIAQAAVKSANTEPLFLAVIGADNFGTRLEALEHKLANGRHIVLARHRTDADRDNLSSYDMLFLALENRDQCLSTLREVAGRPILTISDKAGFAEHGGCIELTIKEGKLRFIINRTAIERQGLKLSYKVYMLALKVLGGEKC